MISPQYYPVVGGYERACERLSGALAERGHEVTVVTERRSAAWLKHEFRDGVVVRRLWCLYAKGFHRASALLSLAWFLIRNGRRFDIWHIHQYGAQAVLGVGLAIFVGRPVVLKLTNTGDYGIQHVTLSLPLHRLAKAILLRASAIIALTREVAAEARAFGYPESRIHLIGNGIDMVRFRPVSQSARSRARLRLGLRCQGLALFVGRFASEKNPEALVRAWCSARPLLGPEWQLAMIGSGPLEGEIKTAIQDLAEESGIVLPGYRSDVEDWMNAADMLIVSSNFEGLSNTMLEGMASGLPIISTKISGAEELLVTTGAGVVVEIGSEEQLASAIIHLAQNHEERSRLAQVGRRVIEQSYSLQSVAIAYERLYLHLQKRQLASLQRSTPQ